MSGTGIDPAPAGTSVLATVSGNRTAVDTGEAIVSKEFSSVEESAQGGRLTHCCLQKLSGRQGRDALMVEWFLELAVGPKIPVGQLVFCPGVPTRMGQSRCQYEAYWNGCHVAVATVDSTAVTRGGLNAFVKNITLLRGIDHPNFVKVYGWCIINRGMRSELGTVMEWCNCGSLVAPVHNSPTCSCCSKLTWRQRLELVHDYAEAARHLSSAYQLTIDAIELGYFLVHCSHSESNRVFHGKIANLGNARQLTQPQDMDLCCTEGLNDCLPAGSDVPSFSRVMWAVAMFGEDITELFWSQVGKHEPWYQGSGIRWMMSRKLPSILFPHQKNDLPREHVILIEKSCSRYTKQRPSSSQISSSVKTILEHTPETPRSVDCSQDAATAHTDHSIEDRGMVLDNSMGTMKDMSWMQRINRRIKRNWESVKQAGEILFQGCCKGHSIAFENDEVITACVDSSQQSNVPMGDETEQVKQTSETEEREYSNRSSSLQKMSIGTIQVLQTQTRTEKTCRTLMHKVHSKENRRELERSGGSDVLLENMSLRSSHNDTARLLQHPQSMQDIKETNFQSSHMLREQSFKSVPAVDLLPRAGFGITSARIDHIAQNVLCVPRVYRWTFQYHSDRGLFPVTQGVSHRKTSSVLMVAARKLYVVDSVRENCELDSFLRRNKLVDLKLRQSISKHILEEEDVEEIIDCLIQHFRERVLAWAVYTQAVEFLSQLPPSCTLCGVCPRPLSLVSEYSESQTLFVALKLQEQMDTTKRWSWLDKMRMMTKIASCVLEFHMNGVAHLTLAPRNVLISSQNVVRLKLGTTRFVEGWNAVLDQEYVSPEQWQESCAGPSSDMYSLAIIFWEIASGRKAWENVPASDILVSVLDGQRPAVQTWWNSKFVSLLDWCWNPNPDARPGSMQLCTELQALLEAAREMISLSSGSDCEKASEAPPKLAHHQGQEISCFSAWSSPGSVQMTTIQSSVCESLREHQQLVEATAGDGNPGVEEETRKTGKIGSSALFEDSEIEAQTCQSKQAVMVINEFLMKETLSHAGEIECVNWSSGEDFRICQWRPLSSRAWRCQESIVQTMLMSIAQCFHKANELQTKIDRMKRDIALFKHLKHPNIVKFVKVIDNGCKGMLVVSKHPNGIPLIDFYNKKKCYLSEADLRKYAIGIVKGLDCMHANNIAHRALRLDNIFVGSNHRVKIKLTAASCCFYEEDTGCADVQGDIGYFAPEMIDLKKGKVTSYSPWSADIFSLGVCLYVLVCATLPSEQNDAGLPIPASMCWDAILPNLDGCAVSCSLKDLLQQLLLKDPTKRIKLGDLIAHEWMTDELAMCDVPIRAARLDVSALDISQAVTPNAARLLARKLFQPTARKVILDAGQHFMLDNEKGICNVKIQAGLCRHSALEGSKCLLHPGCIFRIGGSYQRSKMNQGVITAIKPSIVALYTWKNTHYSVVCMWCVFLAAILCGPDPLCIFMLLVICVAFSIWHWVRGREIKQLVKKFEILELGP